MSYSVGQVLYAVSNSSMRVFPVLIVEEIVKKTLNSANEISYTVMLENRGEPVQLKSLNANIYNTAKDAKEALLSNITKNVYALVDAAERSAIEMWPKQQSAPVDIVNGSSDEDIGVKLADGTIARVKRSKKQQEEVQ